MTEERIPPQSIEAEQAVLGAILIENEVMPFVLEIINEKDWYYFPHVGTEDYQAGWYDKVEAMQGRRNTYYAGEVMSFGDMDETAEYSRELIERFF